MSKTHASDSTNADQSKESAESRADEPENHAIQGEESPVSDDPQAEMAKLKDQALRAMAEAENTRRRLTKELEDARKFAVSQFAKEMLVVADNFRRALEAIPKDNGGGDTLKHLVTGVEATERQLLATFERFGIKKINALGQPFDPHVHSVMVEIEDPSKPVGTVVQVMQEGYLIQDRLLREAMVAISKGGPTAHKVDTQA